MVNNGEVAIVFVWILIIAAVGFIIYLYMLDRRQRKNEENIETEEDSMDIVPEKEEGS